MKQTLAPLWPFGSMNLGVPLPNDVHGDSEKINARGALRQAGIESGLRN